MISEFASVSQFTFFYNISPMQHQELIALTVALSKGASLLKTCRQASSTEVEPTNALAPAPGADPHAFFAVAPHGSKATSKGKKKGGQRRR